MTFDLVLVLEPIKEQAAYFISIFFLFYNELRREQDRTGQDNDYANNLRHTASFLFLSLSLSLRFAAAVLDCRIVVVLFLFGFDRKGERRACIISLQQATEQRRLRRRRPVITSFVRHLFK